MIFWPRMAWGTVRKNAIIASWIVGLTLAAAAIKWEGSTLYIDRALTPVSDSDENLDLIKKTRGGTAAMAHVKKVAQLTSTARTH